MTATETSPRVLLLFFSLSSQTKTLLRTMGEGLSDEGVEVVREQIRPVERLRFPIGTIPRTFWMMLLTFFRKRYAIQPLSEQCFAEYDLVILAGPTWSYNPSGPVLALFDRDGKKLFPGKTVLPLISCRGYWRAHWWGVRSLLRKCGATVVNRIVFCHPCREPWRTLGVFFVLAGKHPDRMWFSRHYTRYGHNRDQRQEAQRFGAMIGRTLVEGGELSALDFTSKTACQSFPRTK